MRFLFVLLLCTTPTAAYEDPGPWIPVDIQRCIKAEMDSKGLTLEVITDENPFYLRGDFDGDSAPDFAVLVMNPDRQGSGIVFCHASGKVESFGSGSKRLPAGLDEPEDLIAPAWEVVTSEQLKSEKTFRSQMPRRMDGEAIYLIWEDGLSLIYRDRGRYVYRSIDILSPDSREAPKQ